MKLLPSALATLVLALGSAACSSNDGTDAASSTYPATAVQTSFPDLPAPTGEPDLAGLDDAHPAAGTVAWVKGPFDDRFEVTDLRIAHGRVTGDLGITSDVSSLLELQVLVHFFGADGSVLGEQRWTLHDDESEGEHASPPSESRTFAVRAPSAYAGKAVSAAAGVTVLVNE